MTLIEVLVAVAVSSVLMGVAISLLLGLKKWDRNLREQSLRNEQTIRLINSIRSDIRRAADVTQPSDQTLDIRLMDEAHVRYELTPEGCRRIAIVSGESGTRAELFAVRNARSWNVERRTDGRRPMIALTLNRAGQSADHVPAPIVVQVILGAETPPSLVTSIP